MILVKRRVVTIRILPVVAGMATIIIAATVAPWAIAFAGLALVVAGLRFAPPKSEAAEETRVRLKLL
jgi:uncharacterized membrane protein